MVFWCDRCRHADHSDRILKPTKTDTITNSYDADTTLDHLQEGHWCYGQYQRHD